LISEDMILLLRAATGAAAWRRGRGSRVGSTFMSGATKQLLRHPQALPGAHPRWVEPSSGDGASGSEVRGGGVCGDVGVRAPHVADARVLCVCGEALAAELDRARQRSQEGERQRSIGDGKEEYRLRSFTAMEVWRSRWR
jgi:hypothetical protein